MTLQQLILESIEKNDKSIFLEIFDDFYEIDIALEIYELDDIDFEKFINMASNEQIALILEKAEEELQTRILELLTLKEIVKVFTYMQVDDVTDILGITPIDVRKKLLDLMKDKDSNNIKFLLSYYEDTAGGIMTTQYIALKNSLSIKDSIQKIKEIGPKTEVIETIYIVNGSNELIGTADLRDILIEPENATLNEILDDNFISVYPETDQEEVSLLVSKYDLKSIPVVNKKNSIIGIITVDDIIDVIVEEQTEDLLMLSGVSKDERVGSSLTTSIKKRLPWLFVNLITAFFAAFTVALFEDVIVQIVALAATMPIVAGMGGNAGSQTLSVVIRSIALGEVNLKEDWKLVFKEILLGVINGFATGIITGIILYYRYGNVYLGLIILIAMVANLVIAGLLGFLIPLILKRLKIDPAVSSSIFLTTATDVFGFFIFLGLAKLFLPLLI